MKRRAWWLLALALVGTSAAAATWETSAYRTHSGQLVTNGMSMVEVVRDAGEPISRRTVAYGVNLGALAGETIEVWLYRGYDGIYAITFTGSRVTRIEVTADR